MQCYIPAKIHAKITDTMAQNCTFDLHININLFLTCPPPNIDAHASTLFIFILKQNLHHTSWKTTFPSKEILDLNNYQEMEERSNLQIKISYIEMEL